MGSIQELDLKLLNRMVLQSRHVISYPILKLKDDRVVWIGMNTALLHRKMVEEMKSGPTEFGAGRIQRSLVGDNDIHLSPGGESMQILGFKKSVREFDLMVDFLRSLLVNLGGEVIVSD